MGLAKRIDVFTYAVGGYSLTVFDCAQCGEVFGMLETSVDVRRRNGQAFYCPNGHTMSYSQGESLQQRELRDAKRRAERAEQDAASQKRMREFAEKQARGANISAGKARAARLRLEHRVNCGVCPHCQRTFKQLAAHISSKHPQVKG